MSKRILAIASAGGHWQQLMLLRPAYTHHDVHYVTTLPGLAEQFGATPASQIPDCNRDTPTQAIRSVFAIARIMVRVRPHVVISTGALPGVIALALGRIMGARTIWVDSVANAEEFSSSGKLAKRFAHMRLSQWETPAKADGAEYAGSVL